VRSSASDQCRPCVCIRHPSADTRPSDWSKPDLRPFQSLPANEVVTQPGTSPVSANRLFHFIVSLSLTFQCNSRSGVGDEYKELMQQCGFVYVNTTTTTTTTNDEYDCMGF
jgi:hypothetical protein